MITSGDILVALQRRPLNDSVSLPVHVQVVNDPEPFVAVEFLSVAVVSGMLVIKAEVTIDDDDDDDAVTFGGPYSCVEETD